MCHIACLAVLLVFDIGVEVPLGAMFIGGARAILDIGRGRGKDLEERALGDRGLADFFGFLLFPFFAALDGFGAEAQGLSFGLDFART